ncbi:MAG: hypothetical protein ACOC8L_07245 [Spirochaetota bacterium]
MGGLYQRAVEYLRSQPQLRLVKESTSGYDEFDGTEEERAQIEREIQQAVDDNKIEFDAGRARIPARKKGSGLPILVNVVAVALTAAGAYFFWTLFEREAAAISRETAIVTSAEGELLNALRAQSEARIAEKEGEIAAIQERISELESERVRLRRTSATALADQEAALRAEFQAAIEAERARLSGLNLSDGELTRRLDAYRSERGALLEDQIAALRDEAASDLARQEQTIEQLLTDTESELAQAEVDRQEVAAQALSPSTASEAAVAQNLLAELEQQQQQRAVVLDQVLGFYGDVEETLLEGNLDAAAESLSGLRHYLETGPMLTHPELQRRREVELFLVRTLEEQLEEERLTTAPDTRSLVESAGLVGEVNRLVQEAERVYSDGEVARARELYVAALSEIPAIELGFQRIEAIEASIAENASDEIAGYIARGNELYRAGEYALAVDAYGRALASLPTEQDVVLERLVDAGYRMRSTDSTVELERLRNELDQLRVATNESGGDGLEIVAERDSAREELEEVTVELDQTEMRLAQVSEELAQTRVELSSTRTLLEEARVANSNATEADSAAFSQLQSRVAEQQEMVAAIERYQRHFGEESAEQDLPTPLELLETKLVILRMVSSDSVEADFPDLYEQLNGYLDDLVAQQRAEASEQLLSEVNRLLSEISAASETSIVDITTEFPSLASTAGSSTAADFFESLRRVTQPESTDRR